VIEAVRFSQVAILKRWFTAAAKISDGAGFAVFAFVGIDDAVDAFLFNFGRVLGDISLVLHFVLLVCSLKTRSRYYLFR
jgi:uncharacterized membrane protein